MMSLLSILMLLVVSLNVVGPIAALLFVKRRSGSWRSASLACLLSATVLAFLLTGTVGWITVFVQMAIQGEFRWDLAIAFPTMGIYGIGFAGMGLLYLLPLIGIWRIFHRRSFEAATNRRKVLVGLMGEGRD